MEHLELFSSFKDKHYGSSGIVFIYNDYILLVRSTYGDWSYPKGRVDKGEKVIDAAIREVREEIGVSFPKEKILHLKLEEAKPVKKGKGIKHYWFYRYRLNDDEFNEYFGGVYEIPKEDLQIEEIDKATFVTKIIAKSLLDKKFHQILDY